MVRSFWFRIWHRVFEVVSVGHSQGVAVVGFVFPQPFELLTVEFIPGLNILNEDSYRWMMGIHMNGWMIGIRMNGWLMVIDMSGLIMGIHMKRCMMGINMNVG